MTNRILASRDEEVEEVEQKPESVKIFLEEIKGLYYAWHTEPKEEFIVQSKTLDGLLQELNKIFLKKRIEIVTSEEIKCQLRKLNTN
jgi:hypothetical protein